LLLQGGPAVTQAPTTHTEAPHGKTELNHKYNMLRLIANQPDTR